MQGINNSNEWINWFEEAISKRHIKSYEYDDFHDIQKIGKVISQKSIVRIGRILINI